MQNALVALTFLAAVAVVAMFISRQRRGPMLEVDELRARLDSDPALLLLDVRTPEEFVGEQGHIEGALNLPLDELQARVAELAPHRDRPIAIVCRTDFRSAKACTLLSRRGFTDVRIVRRGMTAWRANGWSVEHGAPPPARR